MGTSKHTVRTGWWIKKGQRSGAHLPRLKAAPAEQVPARLDPDIFVILGTYFAELEGGAHLAIEFKLLLQEKRRKGVVGYSG